MLTRIWELDARLFDLRVAHGALDGFRVAVYADGTPAVGDFSQATVSATDAALRADRAQLLVSTALLVDHARAVTIAHDVLGADAIAEMLPYLQPAALDRATRHAVRAQDWDLDDLRQLASDAAGVELPKLEQIRRVTWASIVMLAVIGLVAYAVISAVANVGLQSLIDSFKNADLAWLALALALSPTVGVAQAFATIGACIKPVRFGPVVMLQYGIQFVALAVPSSAARIALEIRFFGKVGMSSAGAIAVGVIDSVCGFIVQMLVILVILLSGMATLDLPTSSTSLPDFTGKWLLVAVVVVVLLAVVVLAIPRFRTYLRDQAKDKTADIRDGLRVLHSPTKVLMILGGNFTSQVLFAIILGVCLEGVRPPSDVRRTAPDLQPGEPVRGLHAGAGRDGRGRGRLHRGPGRVRRPAHGGAVHGHGVPVGDVLPASDLGRRGDEVAPRSRIRVSTPASLQGVSVHRAVQ